MKTLEERLTELEVLSPKSVLFKIEDLQSEIETLRAGHAQLLKETRHTCEMQKCDSTDVYYVVDPFLEKIYGEVDWCWLCEECLQERRDDI